MEVTLKAGYIDGYKVVFENNARIKETFESVIPDSMPDASEIIDVFGTVFLKSKTVDDDSLAVAATARLTVLYSQEESGEVRALELEHMLENNFAALGVTSDCVPRASYNIGIIECRLVNSRKVSVEINGTLNVSCCTRSQIEYTQDIDSCNKIIERKTESVFYDVISQAAEKTFMADQQFRISTNGEASVAGTSAQLVIEEKKIVGNKLMFKGMADICALIFSSSGEFTYEQLTMPFSQIMDMGALTAESDIDLVTVPTGLHLEITDSDPAGIMVRAEVHAVAQAVCREKRMVECLTDAYSLCGHLRLGTQKQSSIENVRQQELRETVRETIAECSDMAAVKNCRATVVQSAVNGQTISYKLAVNLVYLDSNGNVHGIFRLFSEQVTADKYENHDYTLKGMSISSTYASATSDGAEIKIVLDIKLNITQSQDMERICSCELVDWDADEAERPSIYLVSVSNGDTLWALAKKYSSTSERIMMVNDIEDGLTEGKMLVIPTGIV